MTRRLASFLPLLAALLFFGVLWSLRGAPHRAARGDEGTYLAMAESLARDGDLWFDDRDRSRVEAAAHPGRQAVILQRVERRVAYSKPVLYPLVAAPFFLLFAESGLILVNALCLAAALLLLARYLRRHADGAPVWPTVISFAGLGLLLVYVPWRTSDAVQASFTLAGLALCLGDLRRRSALEPEPAEPAPRRPPPRLLAGAVLLGLVVSLRLTNGLIALIPVVALWLAGRRRRAVETAAAIAVTLALAVGLSVWLAGAPSPYAAVRATFTPLTGYPTGESVEGPRSPFDYDRASYDRTKKLVEAPLASAYATIYFLVGRHTGVVVYFPLTIFLVAAALRRPDRTSWVVVLAVAALAAFYLVFLPFNYFGGATCVGNRYFLVSYAALPFALRRPLGRRALVAAWAVGLLVAGSALLSVVATRERDPSTQNHAHAGVFRWLPYESVAASIDGVRDVFWVKELGRFVDPFVDVGRWSFRLDSRDPPTEIQIANRGRSDRLRFLVLSAAPRLDFVYSDWGQRGSVRLEAPVGERGLVEIDASRPLRIHPLWFRNVWDHGLPYTVRDFRLAVRSPGREPVVAEVRYLGAEPWPRDVFAREVLELELPASAESGGISRIAVRVRNTSPAVWRSGGVLPVVLGYRLEPEAASGVVVEGLRTRLTGDVPPGGELRAALTVKWPEAGGRYRLTVDQLIEGVAWFGSRVGEPLGSAVVDVGASAAMDPPR